MQASASGCCLTPAGDSDEMDVVAPNIAPKRESLLVCRRKNPFGLDSLLMGHRTLDPKLPPSLGVCTHEVPWRTATMH